jgi:hypothetical protein
MPRPAAARTADAPLRRRTRAPARSPASEAHAFRSPPPSSALPQAAPSCRSRPALRLRRTCRAQCAPRPTPTRSAPAHRSARAAVRRPRPLSFASSLLLMRGRHGFATVEGAGHGRRTPSRGALGDSSSSRKALSASSNSRSPPPSTTPLARLNGGSNPPAPTPAADATPSAGRVPAAKWCPSSRRKWCLGPQTEMRRGRAVRPLRGSVDQGAVGSAYEPPKISVFPNVAGQTLLGAGLVGSVDDAPVRKLKSA